MLRFAVARGVKLDWTFYCVLGQSGRMDDEARSLGAQVVHSPVPLARKFEFVRAMRKELRRGNYDILHAHHDLVSGVYLLASAGLPLQRRIVHVHNAVDGVPTRSRLKASAFRLLLRRVCLAKADRIVAVSNHTLDNFLHGRRRRPGKDLVVYCAVELPATNTHRDRAAFLREFGWTSEASVLVFSGRIVPEKEPLFAVEVLAEMRKRNSSVVGVFIGHGPLTGEIHTLAKERGVLEWFRHLGWRSNVAEILRCCDCFIQPGPESPPEGLGLAVVEAQIAGLHLLFSRGIPDDALLPGASYRRLPLTAGPAAWAEAGLELLALPKPSVPEMIEEYRRSPFEMSNGLTQLLSIYE